MKDEQLDEETVVNLPFYFSDKEPVKVTVANNEPLPARTWAVVILLIVLVSSVTTYLISLSVENTLALGIAFLAITFGTLYLVIDVLSGDRPARDEIKYSHKTIQKQITANYNVAAMYYEDKKNARELEKDGLLLEYQYKNNFLNNQKEIEHLERRLLMLESTTDVSAAATKSNFVSAKPNVGRKEAIAWVTKQLKENTSEDVPALTGIVLPWNGTWKGEEWQQDAKDFLVMHFIRYTNGKYVWQQKTVNEILDKLRYV